MVLSAECLRPAPAERARLIVRRRGQRMAVASRSSPCAAKADFIGQPPPGEADLKAAQAELVALRLRHDESKREWREQTAALRYLASSRGSRIAALEEELAAARKCQEAPAVAMAVAPAAVAPAEASSGPAARRDAEHMLDLCDVNEPGEPGDASSGELVARHVRSAVLVAHQITTTRFTAKRGSRHADQPRPVSPICSFQRPGGHVDRAAAAGGEARARRA